MTSIYAGQRNNCVPGYSWGGYVGRGNDCNRGDRVYSGGRVGHSNCYNGNANCGAGHRGNGGWGGVGGWGGAGGFCGFGGGWVGGGGRGPIAIDRGFGGYWGTSNNNAWCGTNGRGWGVGC